MSYRFYQNKECEYFPCHEVENNEEFNCLFCYCPLYFCVCPGEYSRLEDGRKDCMACTLNHEPKFWDIVQSVMKKPRRDIWLEK